MLQRRRREPDRRHRGSRVRAAHLAGARCARSPTPDRAPSPREPRPLGLRWRSVWRDEQALRTPGTVREVARRWTLAAVEPAEVIVAPALPGDVADDERRRPQRAERRRGCERRRRFKGHARRSAVCPGREHSPLGQGGAVDRRPHAAGPPAGPRPTPGRPLALRHRSSGFAIDTVIPRWPRRRTARGGEARRPWRGRVRQGEGGSIGPLRGPVMTFCQKRARAGADRAAEARPSCRFPQTRSSVGRLSLLASLRAAGPRPRVPASSSSPAFVGCEAVSGLAEESRCPSSPPPKQRSAKGIVNALRTPLRTAHVSGGSFRPTRGSCAGSSERQVISRVNGR